MASEVLEKPVRTEVVAAERTQSDRFYRPNVDIIESAGELTLLVDVPRARSEDVDVSFENGVLTIHAKIKERERAGADYVLHEYGIGDYYRTFQVSEHVDAGRISAQCADGVLTLHLPKVEAVKAKKIAVKNT